MSRPVLPGAPLIALDNVGKSFHTAGGLPVAALRGVSLTIQAGEFVAIMGASGSGKSTLMNIIGCLDRPSTGLYRFNGTDVGSLDLDALAHLRRTVFGFIFQQYNLINTASAVENIEIPAVYAGQAPAARRDRARTLLDRLGLFDRANQRPGQLSGGQQQRVAIARALMNGGQVILADEPTGALDSRSGAEVLALLRELWLAGHTVILVTHDRRVAEQAQRIIEIQDGLVVQDIGAAALPRSLSSARTAIRNAFFLDEVGEAFRAASRALAASPARTALTLLGIVIGVAAMIALVAVGQGAKRALLAQFSEFGANQLFIEPGSVNPREPGGRLSVADAEVVSRIPGVRVAMPYLGGMVTMRYGNKDSVRYAAAVTTDFPEVYNWRMQRGSFFIREDEWSAAAVVVLGADTAARFFPDRENPVGRFVLINDVPFQVVGVLAAKGAMSSGENADNRLFFPFSSGAQRIFGNANPEFIAVLVTVPSRIGPTIDAITTLLTEQHGIEDFQVFDRGAAVEAQNRAQDTTTLLLGSTAAISLLVGGIGVMNIMLMAVGERTREIGIRMAVGARARDILRQFLTEAAMLSASGGIAGIGFGIAAGVVISLFGIPVVFTLRSILFALVCAVITGLVFGYLPARRAARMEPRSALAR